MYLGVQGLSARPQAWEFREAEAVEAVERIHQAGKRAYLALNAVYGRNNAAAFLRVLEQLDAIACDALILGDWGLIRRVRAMGTRLPLHGSTMLGAHNTSAIRLLHRSGLCRVVLSTNLFLDEIVSIVHGCAEMEFELIVHGGVCFNDNRRCRLPHGLAEGRYWVGCRREYSVVEGQAGDPTRVICLHTPDIDLSSTLGLYWALGITSFKIEGRTRSTGYVAEATARLREAVDRLPAAPVAASVDGYLAPAARRAAST
jgi:putative protease